MAEMVPWHSTERDIYAIEQEQALEKGGKWKLNKNVEAGITILKLKEDYNHKIWRKQTNEQGKKLNKNVEKGIAILKLQEDYDHNTWGKQTNKQDNEVTQQKYKGFSTKTLQTSTNLRNIKAAAESLWSY